MKVFVDMDGILADLLGLWLEIYNEDHDDSVTPADVTTWSVHEHVNIGTKVYEILSRPGFFDALEPYPGAVAGFKRLQEQGHEVKILSSPYDPECARAKYSWCERYLNLRYDDVILAHSKELLSGPGRLLIDDRASTCLQWLALGGDVATIRHPYNRGVPRQHFFGDYTDTANAWDSLTQYTAGLLAPKKVAL